VSSRLVNLTTGRTAGPVAPVVAPSSPDAVPGFVRRMAGTRRLPARARRAAALGVGVLALVGCGLLADPFTLDMLSRILSVALLAVSVCVLAGWAGLPTLGQAAGYGVGAYTTALLALHGYTTGLVQVLAAAAAGGVFAALTGVGLLRTRGTLFLMATLALGELTTIAAEQWVGLTGGSDGLYAIPPTQPLPYTPAMAGDRAAYWYVLVVATVAVAVTVLLLRGPAGLLLAGVRDHEQRMRALGHRTGRYLWTAYTAAGALAGVGGSLLVATQAYVSPAVAGFDTSTLALLAVIIGGTTSVPGAMVGAGLLVTARDWLSGPFAGHSPLILGGLLLVAVYAAPDGLAGLSHQLRRLSWARPGRPR
jgi:branched-chain amino acid transport system permease protein